MTVKELIDKLQQFDEDKLVLVEDTEYNKLVLDDTINANGLYVILKASSNRAGFI